MNAVEAYNAGVADLATIARGAADVMRSKLKQKPTRYSFAIEAPDGIFEAAEALTLPDEPMAASEARSPIGRGPSHAGGAVCVAAAGRFVDQYPECISQCGDLVKLREWP